MVSLGIAELIELNEIIINLAVLGEKSADDIFNVFSSKYEKQIVKVGTLKVSYKDLPNVCL